MPDLVYRGPGDRYYPASRDVFGVPLGTVKPGDAARLDEAPDMWWVPYEGGGEGEAGTPEPPASPDDPGAQTSEAGVTGSEE